MHEFKEGSLHSGSKQGPKVKNRKQAVAIAMSESNQSKGKGNVDRSAHYPGNPGFPSSSEAGGSPPKATFEKHESREKEVMGAGYQEHESVKFGSGSHPFRAPAASGADCFCGTKKSGMLRVSGHKGAHQIGKR